MVFVVVSVRGYTVVIMTTERRSSRTVFADLKTNNVSYVLFNAMLVWGDGVGVAPN